MEFGQAAVHVPVESDTNTLLPNYARLRNLTYDVPLYVDITETTIEEGKEPIKKVHNQILIGRIPIMLRSKFCRLSALHTDSDLTEVKECPLDPGGYFIINGMEKVLIAQERMAANTVYVFGMKEGKYTYKSEIRSHLEHSFRPISTLWINLMTGRQLSGTKTSIGQRIVAILPYIKQDIPIMVLFRALGFVSDRSILEFIISDFDDAEMMELIKPSIDEAFVVQEQNVALNFIGARGARPGITMEKRIKFAKEVLQKEMLPHISVSASSERKKAFFLGYMVHRLLLVALGRRELDDRDHFGSKRLDLAGPLLSILFRGLFRNLQNYVKFYAQNCLDSTRHAFNIETSIKTGIYHKYFQYKYLNQLYKLLFDCSFHAEC